VVDEVEVQTPTHRLLERYSAPVYKSAGELLGRIEVYSDVTEVRELERNKDNFLSLVSHELKTPVTSIKGYAQLLRRRASREHPPEQTVMAYEIIERQATRMQELIDVLLDLSRLESGRLALQRGEVNLTDLVGRVSAMVQMTSDTHTLALQLPARPVWIQADERRIEQVIVNLLSNAVRYSPGGAAITVTLRVDAGYAEVAVADEGDGIPPDALPHIFEQFYRASGNAETTGMGIGLYISKGIVEEHGGSIGVESQVGTGSTFTVRLPMEADEVGA
jgi:signal transduction histidine kinase